MHTAGRGKAHNMEFLACFLCIAVGIDNLFVLQDVTCLTGFVNLYKVLLYDTARTDVEMTHFRVAHLPGRQTHIFATGHQL